MGTKRGNISGLWRRLGFTILTKSISIKRDGTPAMVIIIEYEYISVPFPANSRIVLLHNFLGVNVHKHAKRNTFIHTHTHTHEEEEA